MHESSERSKFEYAKLDVREREWEDVMIRIGIGDGGLAVNGGGRDALDDVEDEAIDPALAKNKTVYKVKKVSRADLPSCRSRDRRTGAPE